ncbi:hypothetical protein [Streptosporangium pseudovulgare]|uniref:hypothetical protein n=1 Tax=Streptosporangium pseudovulgare TaxID=35765 RepID=UPI0016718291|nr:hypothetical protein [Streptosporangium pseudovulgare]
MTGRERLPYRRAEDFFQQATRALDPREKGWRLRWLRHCALQPPASCAGSVCHYSPAI